MDTDEKHASDLLRPLLREPAMPSQVDINRAVEDGERRRRLRHAAAAGAAAITALALVTTWALVQPAHQAAPFGEVTSGPPAPTATVLAEPTAPTAVPTTPAPPISCTPVRLPVPAGYPAMSVVTGGDPTGRYILGRAYPGGGPRAVMWDGGKVKTIDVPGSDPALRDVTSSGVAVGSSFVSGEAGRTNAWVYRDGKVSRLAGADAEAYGINEDEVIVGSVNGRPAMWRTPTSQPTSLATPGAGWTGYAAGIDEDGTIVGRLSHAGEWEQGYLWRPAGTVEKLLPEPTVNGKPVTTYTAEAIRYGWIAGWAAQDDGDLRHLGTPRWHLSTGDLDMITPSVHANAVNRHGWLVGDAGEGAVLRAGDRHVRLPGGDGAGLVPGAIAQTINDDGTKVAGQVPLAGGQGPGAVLWTCR